MATGPGAGGHTSAAGPDASPALVGLTAATADEEHQVAHAAEVRALFGEGVALAVEHAGDEGGFALAEALLGRVVLVLERAEARPQSADRDGSRGAE